MILHTSRFQVRSLVVWDIRAVFDSRIAFGNARMLVLGFGFRISGVGFRVLGSGLWVSGLRFQGLEFWGMGSRNGQSRNTTPPTPQPTLSRTSQKYPPRQSQDRTMNQERNKPPSFPVNKRIQPWQESRSHQTSPKPRSPEPIDSGEPAEKETRPPEALISSPRIAVLSPQALWL